jgi:hypothetical protein
MTKYPVSFELNRKHWIILRFPSNITSNGNNDGISIKFYFSGKFDGMSI